MAGNGMLPLGERSFAELRAMRDVPGAEQGLLGPIEHRAFAREFAGDSAMGAASLPLAIPAYTAGKALARAPSIPMTPFTLPAYGVQQLARQQGLDKTRSEPSLDEILAGYHGLVEGILNRLPSAQAAPVAAPRPGMISGRMVPNPRTAPVVQPPILGVRG